MKTADQLRKEGYHQTADAVELLELVQQDHRNLERAYNELINAVARKWPGESRHQTALRYIREAETYNSAQLRAVANSFEMKECERLSPPEQTGARVETES